MSMPVYAYVCEYVYVCVYVCEGCGVSMDIVCCKLVCIRWFGLIVGLYGCLSVYICLGCV